MNKKILISALFMVWFGLASVFSQGENIMIINDVTGEAGEIITVEIAIDNDDPFVGFNLDIPFPDGFTYVPGSAVLYRHNGHQFSFTVPHSNTARIIAFSFTNAEFSGNEGVVMTFELETPSMPGEYILPIVDPIIGNIEAQDITTGTVDGTVTLTGDVPEPGFNLVLQANPTEGGTVIGAGEYDEGTEVEVDAIPNAGWLFVNWTDIDGNLVSEQPDNIIVMPAEDLTLIANFEEDDDPGPDPDPENIMLIPDITANAGDVITIELVVENTDEVVGFSVDVPLPEGFAYIEGSGELFRGTNHDFVFNVIEGNIAKIIAFSITNDAFTGNDGVIFSFDVQTPDMPGEYPLALVDAVLGNADAEDITTGSFDGTLTLVGVENIMKIHDISADAGDIITVEVEIMNDAEFVGFNLDVPLPDGFSYVEGSAQLFREDDHDFGFNITANNVAKIIAFSITNSAFEGNDGVIFSFDLETPGFAGEWMLEIVDGVIGNANAQNILTGTIDGTVTLEGEALPENIMLIPDITAQAGDVVTIEIVVENDDEFAGFSVDVPLPEGFEYIEGTAELFRGTNHDFVFNVIPGNIAKIIAFSITNDSFLGNDGTVFSFDVQTTNVPGEYPLQLVDGVLGNADAEDITTGTFDGTLTLTEGLPSENIMQIHDITANAGEVITVELEIMNDEEFVGFNLDIPLPAGFNYVEGTAELFRGTNHDFAFNVIEGNVAKIIAFSITNDVFTGNEGVVFSFDVETPNIAGEYTLPIVDGVIGNIDAQDILTGTIDGTVILEGEAEPENIMKINDITAQAGDIVTYEIEVLNDEEVVGFSVDVPLPEGFEYVEGTAELFRGTNHDFVFNVIDTNVAKIIAFSITNDAFVGNEGIIFSFDVQTPNVPGEYPLELVDGVLGNADAEDITTGIINGTMILEGDIDPQNIMKINDITAQAGDIVTYEIEVLNDEEVVGFSVDVPLPEGFEYVEGTAELFRGTNHDFVFNVIDTNVAKIIAFSITNDAFVGNEGIIFSFDVQTPNAPGEYPLELVDGVLGNADAEDITTGIINGTMILEGDVPGENIMKIHDVTAEVGDVITVELEIMNDDEFVGFNLDIPLPDGFNYVDGTAQLFRKTNHDFVFNVIEATNVAKIISFSITNDAFLGNDGVIFSFDVTTPNVPGEYLLPIVDGIIGNIDAQDILTGTIDGTVILEGEPALEYTLTLMANPAAGGTVTGGGDYLPGTEVVISATPNTGWEFVNWTDPEGNFISDEVTHVYTMPEEDVTLWANFDEIDYEVVVNINPAGAGSVTGEGLYNYDERVTLVATANEGFEFENWTDADGNVLSGDATYIFDMPAEDVTLTANFAPLQFTLTLIANPEEGGSVTGAGVYDFGEEAEVNAIPNEGWAFINWTDEDGNLVSDQPANVIEITADLTLIANFEMIDYTLTLIASPEEGGTVTGAGVYNAGDEVDVDAIPNEGWHFVNWTDEDGNVVSDQPANTIVMPAADVTLIANFELTTYTLTFIVLDEGTGDPITDAVITLDGVAYDPGVYVFEDLLPAKYDYIVSREDYTTVEGEAEIIDEDVTITVELVLDDDDTSVVDIDILDLNIFPNPASTILNIESNLLISDIRMIDMLGQVVYHAAVDHDSHEISVAGFRNGVYFIQVNTAAGLSTHRVQVVN